jgi:putative hydrolase of the HAD superfamily
VVSNTMRTPGATLRRLLEHFGLLQHFAHTTFSDEVAVRKPAPEIFWLTLRAVGAEAASAVHVGDDPVLDVCGARAAGMRAIQVGHRRSRRAADPEPDAIIAGLAALPQAIAELAQR